MQKAIFLDRDGVINFERGEYTFSPEHFVLNEGLIEFLSTCKKRDYIFIVISNQGGIAKGIYTAEDVMLLHRIFTEKLQALDIHIEEIYFCPHHQDYGKCLCRKPKPLMLEKAIARFNLDRQRSLFIGDSQRDIDAAKLAGVKSVKIKANESLKNHHKIFSLLDAQ